jgi:hypothetical protein
LDYRLFVVGFLFGLLFGPEDGGDALSEMLVDLYQTTRLDNPKDRSRQQ